MTDQAANAFAIIMSKFTDSATSWRTVEIVKTTAKSIFIPGIGWKRNPDRVEIERVVAFVPSAARGAAIIAKAQEVERDHQEAVSKAQMANAKIEEKARMDREAAIQEARRTFEITMRETRHAISKAAQAQRDAVKNFVAAKIDISKEV